MENEITLQFKTMDDLWAFRIEALINFTGMNKEKCLLGCKCSAQNMQLAIEKYKAIVVVGAVKME